MPLLYDPATALAHLRQADPVLGGLIDLAGAFTMESRPIEDLYHPLLRSIVYQQLSGKAAATIFGRILALAAPAGDITPEFVLRTPDETLRAAGMSRAKVAAAKDLAEKVSSGSLPSLAQVLEMPDQQVVRHLTTVKGIGPWTVEMLLIFSLGRPDVLPVSDLGVRKGYMLTYGGVELPPPDVLRSVGERWRPYRSVASWYLWRAVDLRTPAKED